MIICDLRPDTSKPMHPARLAPVTQFASSPDCSFVATAGQKIRFGILGSDGGCTVQK